MKVLQVSAWNDSGGSFLNRLLDGHPDLTIWPFELLLGNVDRASPGKFDDDWFRTRFRWPEFADLGTRNGAELFDSISDLELKTRLGNPSGSKHADFDINVGLDEWRQKVSDVWEVSGNKSRSAFLEIYIKSFLRLWKGNDSLDPLYLLSHCPVAILDAMETWKDFPDTRYLHVVRSPYSGFANMQRRHADLDPIAYVEKWVLVNGFAMTLAGLYPDRVALVSLYSLLCASRKSIIDDLLQWAELRPSERCHTVSWNGKALDPSRMGPFGGVSNATLDVERKLEAVPDETIRAEISKYVFPIIAMLDTHFDCRVSKLLDT